MFQRTLQSLRARRARLMPLLAGLLSLAAFLPGIGWGLPSREDDAFLFGNRAPWTGREIIALAGGFEAASGRGADVDANPLDRSTTRPIVVNDTDAKRAEIVRRYRLQSHQPDEFINFAAIAGMGQRRNLDPRLYQYGGLWVYPVAGLLGAAHIVGYVHLTGDLAWYLDRPEEFGKFYVVARLYSALWGAVGAGVAFVLIRRLARSDVAALCGAIAFALLPVVVTAAHEAKPHLAGAVLVLWAVLKADDYVRTGRRRDALWAGALCGAGSAMVVSMVVGFAILPAMVLVRWRRTSDSSDPPAEAGGPRGKRAVVVVGASALVGALVYAMANPYVVYHLLFDRGVFESNLGNSTAMYGAGTVLGAPLNAARLLALGLGHWLTGLLAVGLVLCIHRLGFRRPLRATHPLGWLLLAAAAATATYFVPLAEGKMPEYARFSIPIAAALLVGWYALARLMPEDRNERFLVALMPVFAAVASSVPYVVNFVVDSGNTDTRRRSAESLVMRANGGVTILALRAEPAPWSTPPFDLWRWRAVLGDADGDVSVATVEEGVFALHNGAGAIVRGRFVTPISWANRPFRIRRLPDRGVEARKAP